MTLRIKEFCSESYTLLILYEQLKQLQQLQICV